MRLATDNVGLVSPRSTCDSIGADTPQRSASSRSDRPMASRSARTRGPTATGSATAGAAGLPPYVITHGRILRPPPPPGGDPPPAPPLLQRGRRAVVWAPPPLRGP